MRRERDGRVRTRNSSRGGSEGFRCVSAAFQEISTASCDSADIFIAVPSHAGLRRRARAARSRSLRGPCEWLARRRIAIASAKQRWWPAGMEVAAAEWRLTRALCAGQQPGSRRAASLTSRARRAVPRWPAQATPPRAAIAAAPLAAGIILDSLRAWRPRPAGGLPAPA